jgi:hypothetical protein
MARGRLLVLRGQSATLNVAWRKALHRPQPERDGGFIGSTDGRVEVRQIPQEDGAEKFQEHYSRVNVHTQLP